MDFLKNKNDIKNWLNQYHITNYDILSDPIYGFIVNAYNGVQLTNKKLESIPIKFNIVDKYFDCSFNQLKNLIFAPKIINGNFSCAHNNIASLLYCPEKIHDFYCHENSLLSLKYGPKIVTGNYYCQKNSLKNLNYLPKYIGGNFNCSFNLIKKLKFYKIINGNYNCSNNKINNLQYAPHFISGEFDASDNLIDSFLYSPQDIGGDFLIYNNPICKTYDEEIIFSFFQKMHKLTTLKNKLNLTCQINKDNKKNKI